MHFSWQTWLDSNNESIILLETTPPDYSFLSESRKQRKGGGVATIIQTSIAPKKVHLGAFDSLEYLAIKDPKKVLILTLYKPPKSKSNFFNDFSNLLSVICMDYD